jgi:hypothetical protein
MAASRKGWQQLSPGYRNRLIKAGITPKQYRSGASLSKARGHAETPEHGITEAIRNPRKYRKYITRRTKTGPGGRPPEDVAREINDILDAAYKNIKSRLGDYHKYKDANVRSNVYGGLRGPQFLGEGEQTEMPAMGIVDSIWTANADTEALRSRASNQAEGNPWFYH